MNDPEHLKEFRRRQKSRARVTAVLLLGLALLIFAITASKMHAVIAG